ncbi:MAG: hypothetical protein CSYNP_03340 [Syntrophus sp. SKADARSKE-3]|nr:hypothetical protein [Syntrophus sp. SKADARSKE-3]
MVHFHSQSHWLIILVFLLLSCAWGWDPLPAVEKSNEFVITVDGKSEATIVIAKNAGIIVRFAAKEMQYHIQKITGALIPVITDDIAVKGNRILIGESTATKALGLTYKDFKQQEYLIRFLQGTIVLMGKDKKDISNTSTSDGTNRANELPKTFDDQGTCYAVYDFLERFCHVRWYAPAELGLVFPETKTLKIVGNDVRRVPFFKFRQGGDMPVYGLLKALWNNPSPDDVRLFARRMRLGGEPYTANHSFYGYYDRFWTKNPQNPGAFEDNHPDWFAQGYIGQPPQMCFTNQGFINQVIQDARDFFDGKGTKTGVHAVGYFFPLVPMDNSSWCRHPECQAQLDSVEVSNLHFSNGYASDYIFGFANKVAREIRKSNPDRYLATLAYSSYAYYPKRIRLESNIAVQLCLQVRNWWVPALEQNDMRFYKSWVTREKDRPIYLWLYYCFPEEIAMNGKWNCFPGFFAHTIDRQFKMFARDGIRGVFLNNLGEYVDTYVTLKFLDEPSQNIDLMIDEYHRLYYGAAAEPMKKFYLRIEEIFSNPENYPDDVKKSIKQVHQTEEIAWGSLGTEVRLAELGGLMAQAKALAKTRLEKQRVALFEQGIWNYMLEGKRKWQLKHLKQRAS